MANGGQPPGQRRLLWQRRLQYGYDGGGLYNYGDATLVNVIFTGNEAVAGSGGGSITTPARRR